MSKIVDQETTRGGRSGRNGMAVPGDECPGVPTRFPPDGYVHVGFGGGSGAACCAPASTPRAHRGKRRRVEGRVTVLWFEVLRA